MKQIREWLENDGLDYAQGVALYEAYGSSSVVLSTLRFGETAFTRQKLRTVLEQLAAAEETGSPPAPVVATAPPAAAPTPAPDEALRRQRSSWFAERHRLHAQLELLATDEERRVASERILVLADYITVSYQGAATLAAAEAAAARFDLSTLTDQGDIRRRLTNLRCLASKLKKNPARALDLQQAQADIKLLESKLLKP